MVRTLFSALWHLPPQTAIAVIHAYQATLSPDHSPLKHLHPYGFCQHHPTCSEYAIEQLKKRGLIVGSILSCIRIVSCNPFRKPTDEKLNQLAKNMLER
jgi:hypothetical protein